MSLTTQSDCIDGSSRLLDLHLCRFQPPHHISGDDDLAADSSLIQTTIFEQLGPASERFAFEVAEHFNALVDQMP